MKRASSIAVILALLTTAPALAQLQVTSVSANPLQVTAGGAAVPLTAYGTGLNTVSGVRLLLEGRAVANVTGTIKSQAFAGTSLGLELKAASTATPATYSLSLIAGTAVASVPVVIVVVGPTISGTVSTTTTFNNPVPVVSTLSPATAAVGSGPDTLIVNGSSFATGAVVQWNGVARPTVRMSSSRLTTTLSATDLAVSGNHSVTVVNPAPGGGTSSARTLSVTAPPKAVALAIGGSTNPARVWTGQPFPLHVQRSGATPTHWRMEWSVATLPWKPMPVPTNYTISIPTRCDSPAFQFQLEIQFATAVGADTLTSNILRDDVLARYPWCNPPYNISVQSRGEGASTHTDIVCEQGKVMSGMQFKALNLGQPNQRITTIGVLCAGSFSPLPMVGSGEGLMLPPYMCSSSQKPEPRIILNYVPTYQGVWVSSWVCAPNPQWLGATYNYDALYSKPVGGEIGGNGNPWIVRCPFNAVPIGLRVGRDQSYGRVATIGMICAAPDTN